MIKILKYPFLILTALVLFGCPSDEDDCTETITIPQFYIINNESYSYDRELEVPCGSPKPTDAVQIEPPLLENFSYEVLSFVNTPDTGNNTSRLQFEIKINNPNDYKVKGVPILTIEFDGIVITGSYSSDASIPCTQIDANSSCILTYDKEASLDLGTVNSAKLIAVKYYLIN